METPRANREEFRELLRSGFWCLLATATICCIFYTDLGLEFYGSIFGYLDYYIPISTMFTLKRLSFLRSELRQYNGVNRPELYLAILGEVFNVTKGAKHYGPGCPYNVFVGVDASRNFVTGKFDKSEIDDHVSDLQPDELLSLDHWVKFYTKEYDKVGTVIGRYYDRRGNLGDYGKMVQELIKKAQEEKEYRESEKFQFPPCNVEWDAKKGSRVWCTPKSGGIYRDWTGFPRQFYEPGSKEYRCACIQDMEISGNLKEYEGCPRDSASCFVKE